MRRHDIGDKSIFVMDGLFDEALVKVMHHYMTKLNFSLSDYDSPQARDTPHWKHDFDVDKPPALPFFPEFIARTEEATRSAFPSRPLRLNRLHANVNMHGDILHPHTDFVSGVTALYFANEQWDPRWMGEIVFYGDDGEPMHLVMPKPGRMIIFSGAVVHRGGVPSRACQGPRYVIVFKYVVE